MTDKPKTPRGTYPPQNAPSDEEFFQQYLQGDSQLSELFQQTESPEPSNQLDQTIIAAAKHQAGKNQWWKKPGSWVATIAVISLVALLAHNTWQIEQDYIQHQDAPHVFPDAPPEEAEFEIQSQPASKAMPTAAQRSKARPEKFLQRRETKDARKPLYKTAPAPVLTIPSENRLSEQADAVPEAEAMDTLGNLSGIKAKESVRGKSLPEADAQQWLEKIKHLLSNNQSKEAQQLFMEFRKKFPDYPVDPVILRQMSPYYPANKQ